MIPLFRPDVGAAEAAAVSSVLASKWTGLGPEVDKFEEEFAAAVGKKYAIALNSGTAALEWYLAVTKELTGVSGALNIPPMTWPGLYHIGSVNCDVDENGNGHCGSITNHAGRYNGNSGYVDDCAHLGPDKHDWKTVVQCWSFHSVKCLSCGDGGMVTTDRQNLAEHCRKWRWFGIDANTHQRNKSGYKWQYDIVQEGGKHHMNDITAAMGRVQLSRWPAMKAARQRMLNWCYPKNVVAGDHLVIYRASCVEHRAEIMQELDRQGIGYGMHYRPIWDLSLFKGQMERRQRRVIRPEDYPGAKRWADTAISLPYGSSFTDAEQEHIHKVMEKLLV